jgi:hypothetical protein
MNRFAPKPPPPMNLARDAIEPIGELEPKKKLLSIHTPFIMHAIMGVFSLLQSHYESNVFIMEIY